MILIPYIHFQKDAMAALEANNHELKKRRIAVTLADSRVRARNRYVYLSEQKPKLIHHSNFNSDTGLGRIAEARSRSVRVRNLPPGTQEGLLQQALEKIAQVKRVEVFVEQREAVVELENAAVCFTFSSLQMNSEAVQSRKRASCYYGQSLSSSATIPWN